MSYQGFGKASGPAAPPKLRHSFGNLPPPVADSPPLRPPSQNEALGSRVQSHPMAFQTTGTATSLHHQYNSGHGATVRMRSPTPSFAFENPRSSAPESYSYSSAVSRGGPGATVRMRSPTPSFAFENPRSIATESYSYSSAVSRGGPGATVRMRSQTPSFAFENPRSIATESYSYPAVASRGRGWHGGYK